MKLEFNSVQYDVRFNHFDMKLGEIQPMLRKPDLVYNLLRPLQVRISGKRPTTNEVLDYVRTLYTAGFTNRLSTSAFADEIESFICDPLFKVTKVRIIALPYFRKSTYWKDAATQRITESDDYSVRDVTIPEIKVGSVGDEAVLGKYGKIERFGAERYIDSGRGVLLSEGFAFCSPEDEFDRGFGRQVALERAIQSSNRLVLSDLSQVIWDEYFKMTSEGCLTNKINTSKSRTEARTKARDRYRRPARTNEQDAFYPAGYRPIP